MSPLAELRRAGLRPRVEDGRLKVDGSDDLRQQWREFIVTHRDAIKTELAEGQVLSFRPSGPWCATCGRDLMTPESVDLGLCVVCRGQVPYPGDGVPVQPRSPDGLVPSHTPCGDPPCRQATFGVLHCSEHTDRGVG